MIVSYHASHEQFTPGDLLSYAVMAEKAGFDACHCSDHFHPWSVRQGQSGFAFAWLGAAMQATTFPFSMVNAPGQRYHPAIVAQAIATLTQMYPGRLDVAFGSGEALNENITGEKWPEKPIRNERLRESVMVIRRLMKGDTVTHDGYVKVKEATLYTRPDTMPLFLGAALSVDTARWLGSWADGLLMSYGSPDEMKKMVDAFREGGGENKPIHVQFAFSYARKEEDALKGAHHQWRSNTVPMDDLGELCRPEHFDAKSEHLKPEDMKSEILITSNLEQFTDHLLKAREQGFDNVILHNVNREQELFISDFGKSVLPALRVKEDITII
ncbi:MAG: Luciferase-like monooxygenase [Cytophagaceae bacterium]|jgi:probable non-F420 flavinoid oxidoreductase|nr:Luciferase-like monooxygenase [Cytophagaceae bacterium]